MSLLRTSTSGRAVTAMRPRSSFSCAATSATCRIQSVSSDRVEHVLARARMVAGDRRQRRPVDAGGRDPLLAVRSLLAQALFVAGAGLAPEAIEQRPALGVELLDGQHRDVAVLGVDPGVGGADAPSSPAPASVAARTVDRNDVVMRPGLQGDRTCGAAQVDASGRASTSAGRQLLPARGKVLFDEAKHRFHARPRADRRSAVTNIEPIVSCVRAIGTAIAQWSALR